MTVMIQSWIKREDLRRNPEVLYVFGDNHARRGLGGQAKEMRHEPNAVGVRTKLVGHMADSAFFTEEPEDLVVQKRFVDEDMKPLFDHVKTGGIVVWPADGVGTGLSELPQRSPTTQAYIESKLASLIRAGKLFALSAKKGDDAAKIETWTVADFIRELENGYPANAKITRADVMIRLPNRTSNMRYSARKHAELVKAKSQSA